MQYPQDFLRITWDNYFDALGITWDDYLRVCFPAAAPGGPAPPPPVLQYPACFPSPQAFLAFLNEEMRRLEAMMKEDLERMKWDPRRTITRDFIVNEIVPNPVVQTATFIAYDLSNADLPGLPQEMPEMGFWVLMNDATEELEVRWWRGEGDPGHIDMPPTPREEGYTPVLWVHIHPPDSKRIWWQMSLADVNYVNNSEVWGMMVDEETWYVYGPHAGAWWPDEPARPPSPRTVDLDKLYDMWEDARLEQELP